MHGILVCISHKRIGPLEATMVKAWARGANLRRWLCRPDCPEVIRQFKHLFDKAFDSTRSPRNDQAGLTEMAHFVHNGVRYSRANTHLGNSLIFYYPHGASTNSCVGSIQKIYRDLSGRVCCKVQRQESLASSQYDPFSLFPLFPAITYSSKVLDGSFDKVYFEDVIGHASRFDFSHNRSVFVNMSRA